MSQEDSSTRHIGSSDHSSKTSVRRSIRSTVRRSICRGLGVVAGNFSDIDLGNHVQRSGDESSDSEKEDSEGEDLVHEIFKKEDRWHQHQHQILQSQSQKRLQIHSSSSSSSTLSSHPSSQRQQKNRSHNNRSVLGGDDDYVWDGRRLRRRSSMMISARGYSRKMTQAWRCCSSTLAFGIVVAGIFIGGIFLWYAYYIGDEGAIGASNNKGEQMLQNDDSPINTTMAPSSFPSLLQHPTKQESDAPSVILSPPPPSSLSLFPLSSHPTIAAAVTKNTFLEVVLVGTCHFTDAMGSATIAALESIYEHDHEREEGGYDSDIETSVGIESYDENCAADDTVARGLIRKHSRFLASEGDDMDRVKIRTKVNQVIPHSLNDEISPPLLMEDDQILSIANDQIDQIVTAVSSETGENITVKELYIVEVVPSSTPSIALSLRPSTIEISAAPSSPRNPTSGAPSRYPTKKSSGSPGTESPSALLFSQGPTTYSSTQGNLPSSMSQPYSHVPSSIHPSSSPSSAVRSLQPSELPEISLPSTIPSGSFIPTPAIHSALPSTLPGSNQGNHTMYSSVFPSQRPTKQASMSPSSSSNPSLSTRPSIECHEVPSDFFFAGYDTDGKKQWQRCSFLNNANDETRESYCSMTEWGGEWAPAREKCPISCNTCEVQEFPSAMPTTTPSKASSSSPTLGPSKVPSILPSVLPCPKKIASVVESKFAGEDDMGYPQEEALDWVTGVVSDDDCDDHAMIVQKYALAVFYFSAGGTGWKNNTGWLGGGDVCTWHGLACDGNQTLTHINLLENDLNGTIPNEISGLATLRHLNLYYNFFLGGTLPETITELVTIEYLDLEVTGLTGTLPDFSSLTNLDYFSASFGHFTGSITADKFELPKLKVLSLSSNNLTGSIPDNFGGSTSLEYIFLEDNLLTGSIPDITGNNTLQNLVSLDLAWNKMSGPVPNSLCNLDQVKFLIADCAPPDNAQNPCPSGCCHSCEVGKGLP